MIDPGEPERPRQADDTESQTGRSSGFIGVIGAVLVIALLLGSRFKGGLGWVLCAAGLFSAAFVVSDVRRGMSNVDPYGNDARSDYVRSADPVGFWVVVVLKGAVAAALVMVGLRLLLGAWQS